jgi:hypothetical protein
LASGGGGVPGGLHGPSVGHGLAQEGPHALTACSSGHRRLAVVRAVAPSEGERCVGFDSLGGDGEECGSDARMADDVCGDGSELGPVVALADALRAS